MTSSFSRRQCLLGGLKTALLTGSVFGSPSTSSEERPHPKDETGASRGQTVGGLSLNEDNSHYFYTRAGQNLDARKVDYWLDQYADSQVREIMLCPNAMRTSYASRVWDPIWRGYDPKGDDDQPLLASTAPQSRKDARKWIHTAWELHQKGIDVYARWIKRCRDVGISPWISVRMNDIHNVDDESSFIHGEFWRQNPQLRRVPYRFSEWIDRAFDYGHPEVRDYHFKLIEELTERYDFDGLELDWMRFGFHFRPGAEQQGVQILTDFTARVRKLLTNWQRKRGHSISLGARVPSRPQTALGLGYDPITWARRQLIDRLVITPFFQTIETDMPVELWRSLLHGTRVTLAAGLELLVRPYPDFRPLQTNSLETVRGAAASLLDRGVDRIYLFNYMDSQTAIDDLENYPRLLREVGSLSTLAGKVRRHIVTYADTWAPGEPRAYALPATCHAGKWHTVRLATGPKPESEPVRLRLGIRREAGETLRDGQVRVNGQPCSFQGEVSPPNPKPAQALSEFSVPGTAMNRGYNLVELRPDQDARLDWVEIVVGPKA